MLSQELGVGGATTTVRPPTNLGTAISELSRRLGRTPNATQLAQDLGLDREQVIHALLSGDAEFKRTAPKAAECRAAEAGGPGAVVDAVGLAELSLERIDRRAELRPLLAALPDRERTVVVLRLFKSLGQSQIAEQIGIPPVQVARLLADSLTLLRDQLG